jgi:PPP family 3-phenylpropionic acid transporter
VPLSHIPYWRLSGFYFFYFGSIGVLVPYWSLYLQDSGFSAKEIGELTAILLATRIVAPYLWGWLADHIGHRIRIVRTASLIAAVSFSALLWDDSYLWIAMTMLLFSFFWNAALPQFEVTTLQYLNQHTDHYSKIRLWGSIGFIVCAVSLGSLLESFDSIIVPYAMLICMAGIWLMTMIVKEPETAHHSIQHTSIIQILKCKEVVAFFIVCFLVQLSHGPFYTFYTLYLEQYHYSKSLIGQLWGMGVVAEVLIFILIYKWLSKIGLQRVIWISALLGSLRWLMIGYLPESITVLILAQLLHAASFGTFHIAAIAWVHKHFIGKNQGRGQAIYSSIGFGAGGALGSLASGYLWLSPGPEVTFYFAAMTSLIACLIAYYGLNKKIKIKSE